MACVGWGQGRGRARVAGIFRCAFACIAVLLLQHISSWYQQKRYREPNCVLHFYGDYGPLHWPQTWAQLHITTLDRFIIDLHWKIAHGVLYTGPR